MTEFDTYNDHYTVLILDKLFRTLIIIYNDKDTVLIMDIRRYDGSLAHVL